MHRRYYHPRTSDNHTVFWSELTEAEFQNLISEVDSDGVGTIDFPDFLAVRMREREDRDKGKEIEDAFKVLTKIAMDSSTVSNCIML
ncbi:uncharacterized protein FA14DRAFT_162866 [Meira miltonrushii]|uniref:EF-hand domain-containing protein n=1 Tax=Meira miltonrushii TaxID=1280837 RepID=A0A316V6X9_9BASI|nr:uncharacterized protein FA14DRAFT_162866 [Meira miltonrushii]PWN31215.1 hypothetical protein FA14DRAFT_162866 [Meira miltonrushii]